MSSIHRLDAHYDEPQTVLRRCTLLSRSVQNDQRRARFSEQSSATNCHSELHACMPLVLQSRYIQVSQRAATNTEVAAVLRDMCVSLERFCSQEESQACRTTRQSMVDTGVMKIMGPRTKRTSAWVYGRAHVQRTQMVDCFQNICWTGLKSLRNRKGDTRVRSAEELATIHRRASSFWLLMRRNEMLCTSKGSSRRTRFKGFWT